MHIAIFKRLIIGYNIYLLASTYNNHSVLLMLANKKKVILKLK